MADYDVIVVGGGPSGLQTARLLAAGGLGVGLFEEKDEIGSEVVCTGIVGREIFREFELPESSIVGDLRSMSVFGPSGRSILYEHPSSFASIVDRRLFDRGLAGEAARAGVSIFTGARVLSAARSAKGVRVRVLTHGSGETRVSSSLLVLATGVRHSLQKELGLGAPRDFLLGVQGESVHPRETGASVYFGTGIAPGAFGWAVPAAAGRTKIGLITDREPLGYFDNLLKVLAPRAGSIVDPGSIRVRPIAQGLVPRTSGERVLVVGEAAGQVKTTTGGGISYGLLGARVASDIILRAFRAGSFGPSVLAEYERLWRVVLKREILVGQYVRRAFAALDDAQIESLLDVARQDGVIPLIRAKGHFDWQSGLILDLLRKAPIFRLFRQTGWPPVFLKNFWF